MFLAAGSPNSERSNIDMASDGYRDLPRLHRSAYQADAAVLWTHTIRDRATGWLDPVFHQGFREMLLHACAREKLLVPAYVLMPDHIHLVALGLDPASDQLKAMSFLRRYLEPRLALARFQPQAHDRALRESDRTRNAFRDSCGYVFANPVRAELASRGDDYPYTGCVLPGFPSLTPFQADYWPKFWRIYSGLRNPACAAHKVSPGVG